MRPLAFGFSAAADGRSYRVDRHTLLQLILSPISALISTDPTATIANRLTAPGNQTFTDVIGRTAAGAFNNNLLGSSIGFELQVDEIIYVSASAAGLVLCYFEDL